MVYKCEDPKRRLDPKQRINKPFKNVSYQKRTQKFFKEGGTKFRHFLSVFFLQNQFEAN